MDKVERTFWEVVGEDVVAAHLELRVVQCAQKACIQVCGEDVPGFANALTEPSRDRPKAGPHFQTIPAFRDAAGFQVPHRTGVKQGLDAREPLGGSLPGIVDCVWHPPVEKTVLWGRRITSSALKWRARMDSNPRPAA